MSKQISNIFILMMTLLFSTMALSSVQSDVEYNERGQIMLETIELMKDSGYVTEKNAIDAKKEFIFNDESLKILKENSAESNKIESSSSISLFDYFNFTNTLKMLAVVAFLIAFRGVIMKLILKFGEIPLVFYQSLFFATSLFLTFNPLDWFGDHASYVKIFGIVANIINLGWIVSTNEKIVKKVLSIISLNIPVEIMLPLYLTVYFGFFAILETSQFLGIMSALSFVLMFGFFITTTGLNTFIGFDREEPIMISIFVNSIILAAYSVMILSDVNIPYIEIFSLGIEYVITICFVIALLIKSSPFSTDEKGFGVALIMMILSFGFALTGALLFDMTVIPAIINTAFFLFISGWVVESISKMGGIALAAGVGFILYAAAEILEKFPELFVTSLF